MSPEEACLLTAAQLGHVGAPQGGQIPKSHLTAMIPFEPPQQPRPWPQADLPCTTPENSKGVWVFKDKDNAATHLVRNCLTRGDDQLLQLSLSARGGLTRRMRDDTAAVYVSGGNSSLTAGSSSSGEVSRSDISSSVCACALRHTPSVMHVVSIIAQSSVTFGPVRTSCPPCPPFPLSSPP